ncbi:hypothetical protein CTAYLR_003275 [Chrysophaeum taylorii]|uniref:ER-bound oxygenase mpaB/mpaB'/Rubber oxygenase catalytic domain-containing protein n=1 Tax=Chrysophaeum taylorii TaxID=2483200 RepID=A0AAD7UAC7_9STRA|nr:hypothetical protein CTAYLR_003275 [Chrysophaeum taylorii]
MSFLLEVAAATVTSIAAVWIWIVQPKLRYRIRDSVNSSMSPREIQNLISLWEDPLLHRVSLEFALFKTYAIPSISKLLHATGEFEERCGRRYDDTDLILREIIENGATSKRGEAAVLRLNEIHGAYKIKNEDFLYTLSCFLLEPPRFFEKYGWRAFTEIEKKGFRDFWADVGTQMGIRDIPETYDAFDAFNKTFEEKNMLFAPSNKLIGDATVDLMLSGASVLKPCVVALLDERLRVAMGYDPAPRWLKFIMTRLLFLRAWVLRVLAAPRPFAIRRTVPNGDDPAKHLPVAFCVYGREYAKGYKIADLGPPNLPKSRGCPLKAKAAAAGSRAAS